MTHGIEWLGGLKDLALGDAADRPHLLLFIEPDGSIRHHEVGPKDALLANAKAGLEKAIAEPVDGEPHTPGRLRVASPELRVALRPMPHGISLVSEPTPEIDAVTHAIRLQLVIDATVRFPEDMPPAAGASFCEAVAELQASTFFDEDRAYTIATTFPGLDGAVVSTSDDAEIGLLLFANEGALEKGVDHVALVLGDRENTPGAVVDAIDAGGWKLASPEAYPTLIHVTNEVPDAARTEHFAQVELVARALARIEAEKLTVDVPSASGPVSITFTPREAVGEEDVVEAFYASEAAEPFKDPKWAMLLNDIAEQHFTRPLEELTARQVEEFVYEIVPRRVAPRPEEAEEILGELRAFFVWAEENEAFPHPERFLPVVDESRLTLLRAAIVNPGGTAKLVGRPQAKGGADKRKAQRKARKKNR